MSQTWPDDLKGAEATRDRQRRRERVTPNRLASSSTHMQPRLWRVPA